MKVRKAETKDLPTLVKLGAEFYKDTQHSKHTPYSGDDVQKLLHVMLENPLSVVFVSELDNGEVIGTAGAMLYPLWMNPKHITGQEMFWYVMPEHRKSKAGKLMFDALEEWASERADSFCVTALASEHEKRVGQMYEKKGYVPLERTYVKEF
jgi:GNAT superfamily N-acetyltransferase